MYTTKDEKRAAAILLPRAFARQRMLQKLKTNEVYQPTSCYSERGNRHKNKCKKIPSKLIVVENVYIFIPCSLLTHHS